MKSKKKKKQPKVQPPPASPAQTPCYCFTVCCCDENGNWDPSYLVDDAFTRTPRLRS